MYWLQGIVGFKAAHSVVSQVIKYVITLDTTKYVFDAAVSFDLV
jgi:hypothetical protein